ncbi:MAG: GTPase/DUF3482 domain-containing protein [Planctomycetia bacterium]|nr:GTPase/DUF3482 domain-containing protein [Planctomycetia bacterium]
MKAPVFVVVGHVNRGKSSIVSTLSADDSVRIDSMPGTTVQCREYPAVASGELLYTLIDTPGFERPRQVLAWLREHETTTQDRREVVAAFVREHAAGGTFRQECELLAPILAGAAILYVVDGSKPPGVMDEAEMEILRWTAQPRVALINLVDKPRPTADTAMPDHLAPWRRVLDQYFNLVRVFDAHEAQFDDRLKLLRTVREMDPQFAEPLDRAIHSLAEDRRLALKECGTATADMLVDMLTLAIKTKLPPDAPRGDAARMAADYFERLRRRERQCHRLLQEIFLHRRLEIEEPPLSAVEDDLLATGTWNRLGLSRTQLAAAGAAGGALAGAKAGVMVDLAVGGQSFFLGSIIGGAIGGGAGATAGWLGGTRLPEVNLMGLPMGGRLQQIGPMKNANFPWIVLDRALVLLDVLARRAHAKRDRVYFDRPAVPTGHVANLPREERNRLESLFAEIRRQPSPAALDALRGELAEVIGTVVVERYPVAEK